MNRWVCLIDSGGKAVRAARNNGFPVLLVQSPTNLKSSISLADAVVVLDYLDEELLATTVERMRAGMTGDLAAVLSFTELGTVPAARLATRLDVPGQTVSGAVKSRDKLAMRLELARTGRYTAPFAACWCPWDVERAVRDLGTPVVLKRSDGMGKNGVRLVRREPDVTAALAALAPRADQLPVLAEKCIVGREFSVESMVVNGEVTPFAIAAKETDAETFVELCHMVPADLTEQEERHLLDANEHCLRTLGVDNAICHTEIMLAEGGPCIVETHSRPGGDFISDLIVHAGGLEIYDAFFGALAGRAPADAVRLERVATVRFLSAVGSYRQGLEVDPVRELPGIVDAQVYADRGVRALRSNADRAGHVIASGVSRQQIDSAARQAVQLLTREVHR